MKLNLGCGMNKMAGYTNVDKYAHCQPDLVMDLEITPWRFADNEVDTILLNHTLEHLGKDVSVFFSIIQEMYRVCKHGATIDINVPHPRHDNFLNDPTHVRIITPELLGLFSKKNCAKWKEIHASNSPLALYLDVDFELISTSVTIEPEYHAQLIAHEIEESDLINMMKKNNNIASEYRMQITPIKLVNP